ncbi:MAG: hypothetical protein QXZ02_03475 [Candidatus Bathyarchaeia archaeon]
MGSKFNGYKSMAFLLIGLIILAGILYLGLYKNFQWGEGGISGNGGSNGTVSSGGKIGVGMTITYADGSTQTVDPSQIQFTLFPLTVYVQNQPISSITWHAYIQLDWVGDMTSLELKGPMEVKSNTGVTLRKENMLKTYTSSNLPNKGAWFEMWKFTLTANDIEYSLGASGDYTLTCTVNVTATAMFSSGLQSVKTASASGNLPIKIQASGLTALLCDVQVQIFQ